MASFLITFKPASENPKRGWPLSKLQTLVRRLNNGEPAEEPWRFINRKDTKIGDRVFLLLQGKSGPAIIGYGTVNGSPRKISGTPQIPIRFEGLVDPSAQTFATREELFVIEGGERENLVSEQSRIINRMKAALIRLGIRGFNPKLKRAARRLEDLRTPEDEPIPPNTLAELRRNIERRRLVRDQIRQIEEARLQRLDHAPGDGPHAMVRLLARVIGVGIETADMLVHEVLSRSLRDRRAVARYAGLTGSPDESGRKRREKGLARSGNGRVRRGMIQLAWRFLLHQKDSALAQWFRARTENARGTRKPMIVALARKLLIALWQLVRQGVVPDGVVLRSAQ